MGLRDIKIKVDTDELDEAREKAEEVRDAVERANEAIEEFQRLTEDMEVSVSVEANE